LLLQDLGGERLLSTPAELREEYEAAVAELGVYEPLYVAGGVSVSIDGPKAHARLMGTDADPSDFRRLCTPSFAACPEFPLGVYIWSGVFEGVKVAKRTWATPTAHVSRLSVYGYSTPPPPMSMVASLCKRIFYCSMIGRVSTCVVIELN